MGLREHGPEGYTYVSKRAQACALTRAHTQTHKHTLTPLILSFPSQELLPVPCTSASHLSGSQTTANLKEDTKPFFLYFMVLNIVSQQQGK